MIKDTDASALFLNIASEIEKKEKRKQFSIDAYLGI